MSPRRFSLIEAGTKSGKSLGSAVWLVDKAWNNERTKWWCSAPVYKQTRIIWDRCKTLMPRELVEINEGNMTLSVANGSVIEGRTGKNPDNLFGDAVNGGVIDEASRYPEKSWEAFRTTITQTRGPMRIIGNPKGRKNWFYRLCQKAKDPLNLDDMAYFHLRTADNPYISPQEILNARGVLRDAVFKELYEGIAQEDITGVFSNIEACVSNTLSPPVHGRPYWFGLDLAKQQNFTVMIGLDEHYRLVYFDRYNKVDWTMQKTKIRKVLEMYNGAACAVDSTGVGDPIYDDLKHDGFNVISYKFTSDSKQKLVEGLAVAIENTAIKFQRIPELISELELFEYQVTPHGNVVYSAPDGYDDDTVVALALARWCRANARVLTMQDLSPSGMEFILPITSGIRGY